MKILTKKEYWNSIPESAKSMWQNTAKHYGSTVVCTHRPSIIQFRGDQLVRRCSTGGRYGKSADFVRLSVEKLLAKGYIFVTYTPKKEQLEQERQRIYSNDIH